MKYGWQLNRLEWEGLAEAIADLSFADVPFEKLHSTGVPKKPGVYMICAPPPVLLSRPFVQFMNVIYVGLSESNIRSRFTAHCDKPDEGIRKAKACYKYLTTSFRFYFAELDASLVSEIETRVINCFGPPANQQGGRAIKGVLKPAKDAG